MADNCTRVKRVVRAWAGVPAEVPISTARVLSNLWIEFGPSLPYCDAAVADLIGRIVEEFTELKIRLKSTDFCPPESAAIRTVGDLCNAVTETEPK
ncbi:MAG: hypothetical protein ACKV2U_05075 [Bryobacteraceae bacterium]